MLHAALLSNRRRFVLVEVHLIPEPSDHSRGYDGGKSRDGRKRHILTDPEGLLPKATVTTADVHDSKAAPALLPPKSS